MLRVLIVFLLVAVCPCFLHSQAKDSVQAGSVDVRVINWHGRELPAYSLTITRSGAGFAERKIVSGPGPRTISLKYGKYNVRAVASLHSIIEAELIVENKHSLLVVSLPPTKWGESSHRYGELIGRIKGYPNPQQKLIVRIVSLFGEFGKYEQVRGDGTFEIDGVPDGEYSLFVLEDFVVRREVRVSKTPQLTELSIDLSLQSVQLP